MYIRQIKPLTVLCVALLIVLMSSTLVFADSISEGPNEIDAESYWIGDEHVKFKAQAVFTTVPAELDSIASNTQYESGTHVWDDEWYYITLPDNRDKFWLISWYNLDAHEYGWLLIDNDPDAWWYMTNSSDWRKVGGNGQQLTRTWWSNGYRIDIDVRNPENVGDWTPNDIWYSFGY
jgi:hypothetical protein